MRPTIMIALACGVAVPVSAQTAPAETVAADTDPTRCKRKNPRGKLFSKRICLTSTQWAQRASEALGRGGPGPAGADALPVGAVAFR